MRSHSARVPQSSPTRVLLGALSCCLPLAWAACAANPPSPARGPISHTDAPLPLPSAAPSVPKLPTLTAHEATIAKELEAYVADLTKLGPRNVDAALSYADATDWLVSTLEAMGFAAERQGFAFGNEVVQNIVVHSPGLRLGWERVVVGARMDSANGSVGADDNASGVAALLCLAKQFYGKRTQRSIDWVWFADAAGRKDPAGQGSKRFLEVAQKESLSLSAMVELYGLGVYSDTAGTQRYADELPGVGTSGDFVGLVSYPQHSTTTDTFRSAFEPVLSMPLQRFTALSGASPVPLTLHGDFLAKGIPALLIYDTNGLRDPVFGTSGDVATHLDYERMARVVNAVESGVVALAGGFGSAPMGSSAPLDSAAPEQGQVN